MNKRVIFYILAAYILALFFRLELYYLALQNPDFIFEGRVISIWTADAGLYGSYAKKLLSGHHLALNSDTFLGYLLYWISKYLHLNLDTVIFFIPAVFASLIVVPIMLMFALVGLETVGFFAALISAIAMNYYFRTHLGYCDTDMLVYPIFFTIIYLFMATIKKGFIPSVFAALFILLFLQVYHSAKPLVYALVTFFAIYVLLFERKRVELYIYALIFLAAASPVGVLYKILVMVALYGVAVAVTRQKIDINYRYFLAAFALVLVTAAFFGVQKGYLNRAVDYLQKKQEYVLIDKSAKKLEFEATLKTIAESGSIDFMKMVRYSSGNIILFILGTIGLTGLILRDRKFIFLLLPYLLGLSSLKTGVRFTTFLSPVLVMGNVYLLYLLTSYIKNRILSRALFFGLSLVMLGYYLYYMHGYNLMLSPFFKKGELKAIKSTLNGPDRGYVLTWWDYGWPLWYYTNKKTIIDNGKHHADNYIVAKTLFSNDLRFVANFDRYFIEQYDRIYPWAVLPYVIKKMPLNEVLKKVKSGELKVEPKNSIYYYFDDRILTKLPVIENFAYLKGERKKGFVWVDLVRIIDTKKGKVVGSGVYIDLKRGVLASNGKKDVFGTVIFHDGKKIAGYLRYRKDPYTIIVYKNRYIIGTVGYTGSFFFRAFFFNGLDKNLFETLYFDKDAKVFKLK